MNRTRTCALLAGAALAAGSLLAVPGQAGATKGAGPSDGVVADGLTDPFGLTQSPRLLVVTEAGAGRVLTITKRRGHQETVVDGLGPYTSSGAAKVGRQFAIVTGEADPSAPPGPVPGSSVLVTEKGGTPTQLADLLAFELENNPDGQTQFGPEGEPLDALSNPFSVIRDRGIRKGFVLVADGGANDVLRVSRDGTVRAFFVPPTVNTGACEGLPNNDESTVGCDAVPTGLAFGPDGNVYISALTAEVPGEGRIYVVDGRTGALQDVLTGFTAPTGVAVDKHGTIFVSELLEGAPAGEPGPDFDPSTVGQIVRVDTDGTRSASQVTMPVGLVTDHGHLWSTAWSVAGLFLGAQGLGQVVLVDPASFEPLSGTTDQRRTRRPSGLGDGLTMRRIR